MTFERSDDLLASTPASDAEAVPSSPGKLTLTGRLAPSATSVAQQVLRLMRKEERDARGVAPDAEVAVARASASSGAPLPAEVRATFEASLGADLSAVRVHTGAASQAAARAVGARAYTLGSDIHFNAGQYAPSDPFGLHLLAHEVAHTVQQAGGAAHQQHKLEVSSATDAAELEADAAADRMVRGAPARVSPASGVALRRSISGDMEASGNAAAAGASSGAFAGITTIHDRNTAEGIKARIEMHTPVLLQSKAFAEEHSKENAGPFTYVYVYNHLLPNASHIAANRAALDRLSLFISADERRSVTQQHVSAQADREAKDFERLLAEGGELLKHGRARKTGNGKSNNQQLGEQLVDSAAGRDDGEASMAADFARAKQSDPQLADAVGLAKTELGSATRDVPIKEKALIGAQATMQGQLQTLLGIRLERSAAAHQADADRAEHEVAAIKNGVKATLDALAVLTGTGALSVDNNKNGWKVADLVVKALKVVDDLTKKYSASDLDPKVKAENDRFLASVTSLAGALNTAHGAFVAFDAAKDAYADAVVRMNVAKKQYRDMYASLAAKLDKSSGKHNEAFAIVAKLLADCEIYLAQADATLAIDGNAGNEQAVAQQLSSGINNADGADGGTVYYTAQLLEHVVELFGPGVDVYKPVKNVVKLVNPSKPGGGSETDAAGAPLDQIANVVKQRRAQIQELADELRKVFA